MALERLNVLIRFALSFILHSPCNCNPTLVFGVSNGSCHTVSFIKTSMDAMALLIGIEIEGREACGDKIQVINLGLDGHIDDRIDPAIPIRSCSSRPDILEGEGLIKGSRKFVVCPLL